MAKIVTISREFGSGGRTIGKAVAQKLGVPYYDKALIKQVSEETGFDPAYIENAGEYAQEKSIFSYFTSFAGSTGVMGGMSASDFLWCMQRKVILDKAEEGPCVIVGRCADFILKDRTDALHVFIHADPAFRADRIVRVYGESERSPAQRLKDKDGRRSVNYKHFNGLAQGLIPIVGYNWGAGNRRRTTEALRVALSGAVALMLCGHSGVLPLSGSASGAFLGRGGAAGHRRAGPAHHLAGVCAHRRYGDHRLLLFGLG